jgi:hypothetical protein
MRNNPGCFPRRREAPHRSTVSLLFTRVNTASQLGFEEIGLTVARQDALNRVVIGWHEFVLKVVYSV